MFPGIKQKIHKSKAKKKSACSIRDTVTFETLSSLFLEIKKLIYKKKKQHHTTIKGNKNLRQTKTQKTKKEKVRDGYSARFHFFIWQIYIQ